MATLKLDPIPPWEYKWPPSALREVALSNPGGYARGYMMRAHEEGDLTFAPYLEACMSRGASVAHWRSMGIPTYWGVDLAGTKRPGNVIVVVGVPPDAFHLRYLMHVERWSGRATELHGRLAQLYGLFPNVQHILVEDNGYQAAALDMIETMQGHVDYGGWAGLVEPFTTTGQKKMSPEVGIDAMSLEFVKKNWVIPHNEFGSHTPACQCGWCVWVREFREYPMGPTTDTVMATWFARSAIREWRGHVRGAGRPLGDINLR